MEKPPTDSHSGSEANGDTPLNNDRCISVPSITESGIYEPSENGDQTEETLTDAQTIKTHKGDIDQVTNVENGLNGISNDINPTDNENEILNSDAKNNNSYSKPETEKSEGNNEVNVNKYDGLNDDKNSGINEKSKINDPENVNDISDKHNEKNSVASSDKSDRNDSEKEDKNCDNSNESDNESNEDDSSDKSDVNSCFGDDEVASHSSIEHWTELEVEKDMMDKLVIHKSDGKQVVNLEIIRQIRHGEFRTDSELSDKVEVKVPPRRGSKSLNKTCARNAQTKTEKGFITELSNENGENAIGSMLNSTKNKQGIEHEQLSDKCKSNSNGINNTNNKYMQSEIRTEPDDQSLSGESDNNSSEHTDDEKSESSDSSTDSNTASLQSSQSDKSEKEKIRKPDSGYSENKRASSNLSVKSNQERTRMNNSVIHKAVNVTPKPDCKRVIESSPNRPAVNPTNKTKYPKKESHKSEKLSMKYNENIDKGKTQNVSSNSEKRREHIAKLKQIYRQKSQVIDKPKASKLTSLPNTNTPKRSLPYSINNVTLHYDKVKQDQNQGHITHIKTKDINTKDKVSKCSSFSKNPPSSEVRETSNALLAKRKDPPNRLNATQANINVGYIDLKSNKTIDNLVEDKTGRKNAKPFNDILVHSPCETQKPCHKEASISESNEDKSINRFHNEIKEICNKEVTITRRPNSLPKHKVDRRMEITMNEMIALHGGSSLDTNDSDFAVDTPVSKTKNDEPYLGIDSGTEIPAHVAQALIADMPIQKLSAEDIVRPSSTNSATKRKEPKSGNKAAKDDKLLLKDTAKDTNGNIKAENSAVQPTKVNDSVFTKEKNDDRYHVEDRTDIVLQEKRKRLQASKTYENIREYKHSESIVTSQTNSPNTIDINEHAKHHKSIDGSKHGSEESASSASIVSGILDTLLHQLFTNLQHKIQGPTKRCTTLDNEGNEVLCCILQAPDNNVDPSTFTCEVVDPLDVPPITRRHELLISHVIKISTYNVGHIAREREMVAKIPIAHFFVEPWQEVVIREVDKSGHWTDTGEDVDIVQIPDISNVVYGVQIVLKELTYVAVVTRPRITTVTLEHRDKIISSPSDVRVKLRVPGTSDPRHVSLQSIPITEKIIKEFENTRGPEMTSYLAAASPMVILSLEGPNPESFSFALPFMSVNYVEDQQENNQETLDTSDVKAENVKSSDKANEETEEIPNVPPRVLERMKSDIQQFTIVHSAKQKHSAKSQLQELETKVHKREKERYLVLLGEGQDKSIQIKLLDDSDRVKSFDIESTADEVVKFSVYDTYVRLFALEVHDIVNFQEIQSTVKGLANYILKHRVRVNVYQDKNNLYNVKFTATVDQPYRQKWPRERQCDQPDEGNNDGVRYLEMNEGDAIGLSFRGNIEVTNQTKRVFSFHGYCGIYATFDLKIKDPFSQKSLPEFHGAVQVYTLKRTRTKAINTITVQNVSTDWDLFTEYHFMLPKQLKRTPIIVNRAPISLRFQEPLTVEFVRLMCRELLKDWDTFAFSLGISTARIQAIKQHNRNQISERVLMDVIVCWMKHQPVSRDKVGPILAALRMCRKPHLENELTQRHKALKDTRAKTARDRHIQRAALALSNSRAVSVRWRQLIGYLLHLELNDVRICDITSEIEEKYKNDATKCYHALQYWNSLSGSPTIWKIVDALRHCNCHVAANTLRVQEQKRH